MSLLICNNVNLVKCFHCLLKQDPPQQEELETPRPFLKEPEITLEESQQFPTSVITSTIKTIRNPTKNGNGHIVGSAACCKK